MVEGRLEKGTPPQPVLHRSRPREIAMKARFAAIPVALVLLVLGTASRGMSDPALHLELVRSAPMADSTVTPPSEIRVWFSEVPLFESTTVRLLDSARELVAVGATTRAPDDGRIYSAAIERPLRPGRYTVAYRTLASDGHVVSAEFGFTVRAADD
jgi:methionine-rich copper-binding protein CopC